MIKQNKIKDDDDAIGAARGKPKIPQTQKKLFHISFCKRYKEWNPPFNQNGEKSNIQEALNWVKITLIY